MDRALHAERVPIGRARPRFDATIGDLPDGVMVVAGDLASLVLAEALRPWSPAGYGAPRPVPPATLVNVLTPRAIVRAMRAGYEASIHATAT
jgi:hypothetical protein